MGRTKGSSKGIPLSPDKLAELATSVREVGCNAVARKIGCSKNYISLVINGVNPPSPRQHSDMKQAVKELKEGNVAPIIHEPVALSV